MKAVSIQSDLDRKGEWGEHLLDPHHICIHSDLETLRTAQHDRSVRGLAVWDLSMVNPDLPPPRPILDRLLESVTKTTNHRYAVSRGVRRLREGFSTKYGVRFGQKLDPETQVCVCLGSKDATFHALRVLLQPGDAVVVLAPSYPAHPSAVALAGGRCIPWEFRHEPEMAAATLEKVLRETQPKVLLLNVPSNPLGVTVTQEWWLAVGAVCARAGVTIVNDFVYGEMGFAGAVSAGARCVEVYSLSKAYNVPGWRVGALVGDVDVVRAVSRVKSNADYGLFLPLQYAATLALTSSEDLVRPTVQTYERRLKVLAGGLEALGWSVVRPEAGACLWTKFPERLAGRAAQAGPETSRFRSIAVAHHMLATSGIVVTPGVVCGAAYDSWVRFAAVSNEERLREVLRSLEGVAAVV
jgi:alanine-synthesizing transaminase